MLKAIAVTIIASTAIIAVAGSSYFATTANLLDFVAVSVAQISTLR